MSAIENGDTIKVTGILLPKKEYDRLQSLARLVVADNGGDGVLVKALMETRVSMSMMRSEYGRKYGTFVPFDNHLRLIDNALALARKIAKEGAE